MTYLDEKPLALNVSQRELLLFLSLIDGSKNYGCFAGREKLGACFPL